MMLPLTPLTSSHFENGCDVNVYFRLGTTEMLLLLSIWEKVHVWLQIGRNIGAHL